MTHESETQPASDVQGMHCELKGEGTIKCTVTLSDVCLTQYSVVPLFVFGGADIIRCFPRISRNCETPLTLERVKEDFTDLLLVTEKVHKAQMSLRSGDKIITYTSGQPVQDESDGFLELSPRREAWWTENPKISPIVESIREYIPDFSPWLLQRDPTIATLSGKSALL